MNDAAVKLWARRLAWAAGLMDFTTGLGLVVLPALTLRLMLVPVPGGEGLVYVRFLGVFVGAVGLSYLWALARGTAALRAVFGFTIPFRVGGGAFCAVAVGLGALAPAWLTVTLADFGLVALQAGLLRREWGRRHEL